MDHVQLVRRALIDTFAKFYVLIFESLVIIITYLALFCAVHKSDVRIIRIQLLLRAVLPAFIKSYVSYPG